MDDEFLDVLVLKKKQQNTKVDDLSQRKTNENQTQEILRLKTTISYYEKYTRKIEKDLKNIMEKINILEKMNSDLQTIIDKLTSMIQLKYSNLMEISVKLVKNNVLLTRKYRLHLREITRIITRITALNMCIKREYYIRVITRFYANFRRNYLRQNFKK